MRNRIMDPEYFAARKKRLDFGQQDVRKTIAKNDSAGESENPKFNPILRAMGEEFGFKAAHAILSYMSQCSLKPMSEILSNYEAFTSILKQVYTVGVAEKEILGRLAKYELQEKFI